MTKETKATTILCIRKNDSVFMIADGQVSRGSFSIKHKANKIRKIDNNKVLVGFAGSVSDAFTLVERLEVKLKDFNSLERACYELMKEWRTDKYIRHLEAELIVSDFNNIFILSGDGTILEPDNRDVASVGSGSLFATSAAIALYENTDLSAKEIAIKSMTIAANLCIYTNANFTTAELKKK